MSAYFVIYVKLLLNCMILTRKVIIRIKNNEIYL